MFIILVYASVTFKTKCDIRSVHEHLKKNQKKKTTVSGSIWKSLPFTLTTNWFSVSSNIKTGTLLV